MRDSAVDNIRLHRQSVTVLNRTITAPTYLVREIVVAGVVRRSNLALVRLPFGDADIDGILNAGLINSERSNIFLDAGRWRVLRQPIASPTSLIEIPSQFRPASGAVETKRLYAEILA